MQVVWSVSSTLFGLRALERVHPKTDTSKSSSVSDTRRNRADSQAHVNLVTWTTILYTVVSAAEALRYQISPDQDSLDFRSNNAPGRSQYVIPCVVFGIFTAFAVLDMVLPSATGWESPPAGITVNNFAIRYGAFLSYALRAAGLVGIPQIPQLSWGWPPLYALEWGYTTFHMVLLLCDLAHIEFQPALRLALFQLAVVAFGAVSWCAGDQVILRWFCFSVAMCLGACTACGVAVGFAVLCERSKHALTRQKALLVGIATAVLCCVYPFVFVLDATGVISIVARETANAVCDLNCKVLLSGVLAQLHVSQESHALLAAAREQYRQAVIKANLLVTVQQGIKAPLQSALATADYSRAAMTRTRAALRAQNETQMAARLDPVIESCGSLESRLYQMRKVLDNVFLLDAMRNDSLDIYPRGGGAVDLTRQLRVLLSPVTTTFDLEAAMCVLCGGDQNPELQRPVRFDPRLTWFALHSVADAAFRSAGMEGAALVLVELQREEPDGDTVMTVTVGDSGPTLSFDESGLGDDLLDTSASQRRLARARLPKGRAGSRLDYSLSKAVISGMGGSLSLLTELPPRLMVALEAERERAADGDRPSAEDESDEPSDDTRGQLSGQPGIAIAAASRCKQWFSLQLRMSPDPAAGAAVSMTVDRQALVHSGSFSLMQAEGFPAQERNSTVVAEVEESTAIISESQAQRGQALGFVSVQIRSKTRIG